MEEKCAFAIPLEYSGYNFKWTQPSKTIHSNFHFIFDSYILLLLSGKCLWPWHLFSYQNLWFIDFHSLKKRTPKRKRSFKIWCILFDQREAHSRIQSFKKKKKILSCHNILSFGNGWENQLRFFKSEKKIATFIYICACHSFCHSDLAAQKVKQF